MTYLEHLLWRISLKCALSTCYEEISNFPPIKDANIQSKSNMPVA